MSSDVFVEIHHNVKTGEFHHETNLKEDKIQEVLEEYVRSQTGAGRDPSPPDMRDEYTIRIGLDLSDDTFRVSSDCGNNSLREGIVMAYLQKLSGDPATIRGE